MSLPNNLLDRVAMDVPGDETISALLARRARLNPEEIYCTFQDECITFRLLDRRVNQMATMLARQGLSRGDRVAVMLPSHPEHLYLIFALARTGMVRVPINVHLMGASLEHLISELEPKAIVVDSAYRAAVEGLGPSLPKLVWRNGTDGEFDRFTSCAEYEAAPDVRADDIIALSPSSGTTGSPKGVLKTDRHLRAGPMAILRLTE